MTRQEIQQFLEQEVGFGRGMGHVTGIVGEETYALPTKEWVVGRFAPALFRNLTRLELKEWELNRWDCSSFSLLATGLAKTTHGQSYSGPDGLAFGFVGYLRQTSFPPVNHQTCFAVVKADGKPGVVFFEPQTQTELSLTRSEIDSIAYYYI